MSVPSFQQLMLPALQTIGQRYDEISIAGLEEEVGKALRISLEERQVMLPSGNQTLFGNRLNWAQVLPFESGPHRTASSRLLPRHRPRPQAARRGRERDRPWAIGAISRIRRLAKPKQGRRGGGGTRDAGERRGVDRVEFRAPQYRAWARYRRAGPFLQSGVLRAPDHRPPGADGLRRRPRRDGRARSAGSATAASTASSRRTSWASTSSMSRPSGSIPIPACRCGKCAISSADSKVIGRPRAFS